MNFSLYVIGTPNGYDQYPLDSNSSKFQEILTSCNSESQLYLSNMSMCGKSQVMTVFVGDLALRLL